METGSRILILEETSHDAQLLEWELRRSGLVFTSRWVNTEADFLKELREFVPELILAEYEVPGFDGLAALALAQQQCPDTPFVFVSGVSGEEIAAEPQARRKPGPALKNRLVRPVPAVRRALQAAQQRLERRQTENAVRETEAKFAAFAEIVPAIIFIHQEGKFCFVNATAERILGYSRAELLSMYFWEVVHPDFRDIVRGRGMSREQGEDVPAQSEFQILSKRGETRWLQCTACRIQVAGQPAVLGSAFDITARRNTEEALRQSEQHFREVVEHIREVFWMTDARKNRMVYISPGYEQVWGRSCASLHASPRDWLAAVHPEDRERVLQSALTKQVSGQYHEIYRIVRPDGSIRWIEDRAFPVRNEAGEVYRITGIAEDITARKRAADCNAAFSKLGLELSAATTPTGAAAIIARIAAELFGWDACYLHLYFPERDQIQPVLTMDTIHGRKVDVPSTFITREPSPMMLEVMQKGPRLVNREQPNTAAPDPILLVPFGDSTRRSASMMYVPLRHGSKIIGIFSVQSYTPQAYSQEQLGALQALADHCGGALERIRAVLASRQNELKNRLLLNSIPHWMFRVRKDGTILDFKAPRKFAAEATAMELIDKNIFTLWPGQLTERFRQYLALRAGEEQIFEFQYPLQGELYHFEAQVVASEESEVLAIVRDVSERKRLETELLSISAREQRRIGHDLHDGLGQYLAGVALKARLLEDSLSSANSPHTAEASKLVALVNNAIGQARTLARGLDPIEVAADGLCSALQRLASETEVLFGVRCLVKIDRSLPSVDKLFSFHLYRIAQEAITNAIKHGKAGRIDLELAAELDQLRLTIRDDGKGFVPEQTNDAGMGLRIIQYRAQSIGGAARIQSQPHRGAQVQCTVPLNASPPASPSQKKPDLLA